MWHAPLAFSPRCCPNNESAVSIQFKRRIFIEDISPVIPLVVFNLKLTSKTGKKFNQLKKTQKEGSIWLNHCLQQPASQFNPVGSVLELPLLHLIYVPLDGEKVKVEPNLAPQPSLLLVFQCSAAGMFSSKKWEIRLQLECVLMFVPVGQGSYKQEGSTVEGGNWANMSVLTL